MTKTYITIATIFLFLLTFTSCEKDPVIPLTPELITTVNYSLTPVNGDAAITLSFKDLDGDGGNDPVITGGTLKTNTSYLGELVLLNEAESPTENITLEIEEEALEHQFFFQSDITGISVAYDDIDDDGNPLGLKTNVTTTDEGSGIITVILRHEPNKSGSGVSDGDITNAGGETDIEVTFPINVE